MRARGDRAGYAAEQEPFQAITQTRGSEKDAIGSPFFRKLNQHLLRIACLNEALSPQTLCSKPFDSQRSKPSRMLIFRPVAFFG